jgi:pyrophosphatase PpaX
MWSNVDAVLFDLDGTLVDTIPLIFACYHHALSAHLPDYHPEHRVLVNNLGRSLDDILYDYAVAAGADDPAAMSQTLKSTYRAFQKENLPKLIRPYEGMREALVALRAAGLRIGIVTSKTDWAARASYERYGLGEFFSVGVFHDDTTRHKPDPEPLLLAASRGGLDPARCVYVGDSIHDIAAGKAAGMRTIAALWGPADREDLVGAGADELATVPLDLLRILVAPSAPHGQAAS